MARKCTEISLFSDFPDHRTPRGSRSTCRAEIGSYFSFDAVEESEESDSDADDIQMK